MKSHNEVYWVPEDTASPDQDTSVSYWDFLPPEMQEIILHQKEKLEIQDNISKRLTMGWDKFYQQMDELPRCRVHSTVSHVSSSFQSKLIHTKSPLS